MTTDQDAFTTRYVSSALVFFLKLDPNSIIKKMNAIETKLVLFTDAIGRDTHHVAFGCYRTGYGTGAGSKARGGPPVDGRSRRAPRGRHLWQPHMNTSNVALVMMDDRLPNVDGWTHRRLHHELTLEAQARLVTALTSYLNLRYACRNNYALIFYHLSQQGCMHPLWGARHPSYCKLSAIGDALAARYQWVVYLDSDAFIRSAESLPALLQRYGANAAIDLDARDKDFFFGWDHPFTLGPNMGFIAIRNTAASREMVRTWWNSFSGGFSTAHPYEQHALQWNVMHLSRYRTRLQTLSLRTMDASYPDAVVHLDHNAGTKTRIWVMVGAAAELLTSIDLPHSVPLRRHLAALREPRAGLSKKQRRPVIEAVAEAVGKDLEFMSMSKATCRWRMVAFNASHSALALFWQITRSADAAPDSRGGNRGVTTAPGMVRGSVFGRATRTDAVPLLAGTPLRLVNCSGSALHSPWQTWRLSTERLTPKGQGACQGLCLAHRFSLEAAPRLCLSLGTTRTPRNPYQPLAQLERCDAAPATAAALRARLHYSPKTLTIKTTHRVSDFRKGLPEHKLTCGFWPACSGTHLLLPKPCWPRLRTNVTACGEQEEMVSSFLERDRRMGTHVVDQKRGGFVIGAGGPIPASMLNTSGRDRLCLTAWRGQVGLHSVEGTAAVFLRCPQGSGRRWRDRSLFEWQAESVSVSSAGLPSGVRLKPRAGPHLCLSAPPMAAPPGG